MADESIRLIPLSNCDQSVIIDAADFPEVSRYTWRIHRRFGYALRSKGHSGKQYLHRLIMMPPDGVHLVDHINGNKLDNRRDNLRLCNKAENARNSFKRIVKTSRFKGVHWNKRQNKWIAKLMLNRRSIHIGTFGDEADAALAYDIAARTHFGEFARTNFSA